MTKNKSTRSTRRATPMIPKAGSTNSGHRTYGNGGKTNY